MLVDDVTVPPRSQIDVNTKAVCEELSVDAYGSGSILSPRKEAAIDTMTWGTQPHEIKDGLLVARTLLPDRVQDLPVRLMNTTDEPVTLCRDTMVSELEELDPVQST